MFHPDRILLPTDLSDLSLSAFPWAVRLAKTFGSTIEILYADLFADPIDLVGGGMTVADPERIESLKGLAQKTLAKHAEERVPAGVAREIVIDVDAPYRSIVRRAESAGLVVMGTHGRSGWRRALLGSVTETVLRETATPVLTIRLEEATPPDEDVRVSRIVCPVNYTAMAQLALAHAADLAAAFDAELVVVHVSEAGETAGEREAELETWVPSAVARRMKYRRLVLRGDAAEEVVGLAKKESADLVVVGAQHRRFSDTTVIGVTTERITRHAPCAVMTVHRAEA